MLYSMLYSSPTELIHKVTCNPIQNNIVSPWVLCLHVSLLLLSGAIYAESSEVHIRGDTIFANNTAEEDGGEVYCFTCGIIITVPLLSIRDPCIATKHEECGRMKRMLRGYIL